MIRRIAPLRDFLRRESSSGVLLLIAAILGLVAANTPIADSYFKFLEIDFKVDWGGIFLEMTILKVINYGLMTIFFFVVGLEIKREVTSGHLSKLRQAAAPFFAAIGGMAIPAVIYLAIAGDVAPEGWAIPVATDIALAVGLLALMGSTVTQGLKAFLLALAVIDDIGAILIIALVYSSGVIFSWLLAGVLAVIVTLALQRLKVMKIYVYIFVGALLWYSLYKAGLHPTLAGVIMGILAPAAPIEDKNWSDSEDGQVTIVEKLEARFHGLSTFFVVPIFAFANAGVELSSRALNDAINSPIAWGIVAGLVLGKPIGVFATAKLAAKVKLAELPEGGRGVKLLATGSTAGIGFTVAIFIAKLAFEAGPNQDLAVTAVIFGSLISGLIAVALFRIVKR
ncbi:MAG: Na+/H+ antiporter NhaA [Actinobacteria bacterium]|nr:Na+/H+ antiporter NhaA [Actinomycetota bacterium]NDB49895.1 Na+/H+ antiporter NhaA [Actinomycetota bacterium]